jgi:hypothetical protein
MESNDQETENTTKLKIMNHRERNNRENNRKNQIEKLLETSEENAANETDKS